MAGNIRCGADDMQPAARLKLSVFEPNNGQALSLGNVSKLTRWAGEDQSSFDPRKQVKQDPFGAAERPGVSVYEDWVRVDHYRCSEATAPSGGCGCSLVD